MAAIAPPTAEDFFSIRKHCVQRPIGARYWREAGRR